MVSAIRLQLKRHNPWRLKNVIAAGYLIIGIIAMQNYLRISSALIISIVAVPLVLQTYANEAKSFRYAWIAFIGAVLCFLMPVKTLLYFTICFALVFGRESFYGKTGILIPIVVLLASPGFEYLASTFSFPLRLQLTQIAGGVFQLLGFDTRVEGNIIIRGANEFSVDPACMGLNMITTSLLFGIMILSFYRVKLKRRVIEWKIFLYILGVFTLTIIANLFRIIVLVFFNIPANTISHEIAGLGCLFVYTFIPVVWFTSFWIKRMPEINKDSLPVKNGVAVKKISLLHLLLLISIIFLSWKVSYSNTFSKFKIPLQKDVSEYSLSSYLPGIVKLENESVLIYIKHIRGFYDTDHNPMICWKGSGYQIRKIVEERIEGSMVYTAMLENGNNKLYTAWWYANGQTITNSQFKWRIDLLKGKNDYSLVNVTCAEDDKLRVQVKGIIKQNKLSQFFKN